MTSSEKFLVTLWLTSKVRIATLGGGEDSQKSLFSLASHEGVRGDETVRCRRDHFWSHPQWHIFADKLAASFIAA